MLIKFSGRIHPERACVTLPNYHLSLYSENNELKIEATLSVSCSQISLTVAGDIKIDIDTLKHSIEIKVRNFIDAYGYLSGRGYDAEIISATFEDGTQKVFGVGHQDLETNSTHRPYDYLTVVDLLTRNEHLANALADLREAIRTPAQTFYFCYRAIECIRQNFKSEHGKEADKKSWLALKEKLSLIDDDVRMFEEEATHLRHGGALLNMTAEQRSKTLLKTTHIIDSFCIFLKNL